ncbi:S1/P1 nuclease [Bowmanella yangjiangensis]|uniref:S1/P1 nuclease n=1 Tax=Bowmanella yangjiangensis TaxID=2811230 RepID=A0ABS3CQW3_9ALTE|nr:S1/P1 nuclease [Bowmanella yangjiangensis]MBN7819060.1 S1/P1 nuclease [Bowmanella yangjiangensis]
MKTYLALVSLVLSLLSGQALAWGEKGHRTVALLAYAQLSQATQQKVDALLKHKGFKDIGEASVWADKIREQKLPAYAHTGPWHYVNLPRDAEVFEMSRDCARPCIVSVLKEMQAQLQNGDKDKQAEALAFVVHLVGDIHQPMHVSFADDKGGNTTKVKVKGDEVSLHYYWDGLVLKGLPRSEQLAASLMEGSDDVQRSQWQSAPLSQWIAESFNLTRQVYANQSNVVDAGRQQRDQALAIKRLQVAGARLASLLEQQLSR